MKLLKIFFLSILMALSFAGYGVFHYGKTVNTFNHCQQNNSCSSTTDSIHEILKTEYTNLQIDSTDTVTFDLSRSVMTGNYIEIPVSFQSDDNIYSMDFSLKYDNQQVEFDSIINLTTGLNYLYYLNPADSTLRFTSYCLNQMPDDSAIITVRFTSQSAGVCNQDLNTISCYLNGDECSYKVTDCDTVTTQIISHQDNKKIAVYPNPANQFIEVNSEEAYVQQIIDGTGKTVFNSTSLFTKNNNQINTSKLQNGLYFVKIQTGNGILTQKLIIRH